MLLEIIVTKDNSHTIYLPHLNEHYHSIHGAIQESQHVFIRNGLGYFLNAGLKEIKILEVGFGTGLNALLTGLKSIAIPQTSIYYTSIELNPLPQELIIQLNYAELTEQSELAHTIFNKIHTADWNKPVNIHDRFTLHKIQGGIQQTQLLGNHHLIYFDAFAPDKQPDMWTIDVFQKLFLHLQPGGALVTYCAKGIVKRTLKSVGFVVEALQGPPGKREMIRAFKSC